MRRKSNMASLRTVEKYQLTTLLTLVWGSRATPVYTSAIIPRTGN